MYAKKIAAATFLFFLVKGLLWLVVLAGGVVFAWFGRGS